MSTYTITDHIFGPDGVGHRSFTMLGDPRNARYAARQTTYGAWRVFDFHINSWVGNGWEEQGPANSLARKLNRGGRDGWED